MKRTHSLQNIGSVKDILMFGKYKDSTVEDVIHDDAQYLEWAMSNNIVSCSDQIRDIIYDYLTYC